MTFKEIFQEIWSIKDDDVRAKRIEKLDADVAAKIITFLRNNARFQSVLDDPLIFLSSPEVKDQTARYSVTSELAKGGMGVVYAAYDSQMRRDVVLKCLLPKHQNSFQALQRFYNEAHITGQLQHPGIAPVYELGELEDGRPFYCMKLVEGKTLTQFLADRDSPSEETTRALNFFLQICQTMAFAHERGIVHRDLKPSNIMVGKHGQTQVMDWGVAKNLATPDEPLKTENVSPKDGEPDGPPELEASKAPNANPDLTRYGQVIGTPGYMSPEQAFGQNDLIDKQSDVYSLGAILCEILTGASPGSIESRSADQAESESNDFDQRLINSDADLEMADLVRACLQRKPQDRPKDADAVAQVVLAYFASREDAARATQIKLEKELTRNEETGKRRFVMATCVAACLSILVAGIVGTSIGFYKESVARTRADEKANDAKTAKDLAINAKIAADDSKAKAEIRLEQLRKGNEILGSVFENLHPYESARTGKPLVDLLVKNLDQAAEQLEEDSIGAPDVVAAFQTKIGKCYRGFGLDKKAIPLFEKAHDFAVSEYGVDSELARNARYRLAGSLSSDNQTKRAEALYQDLHEACIRAGNADTREFFKIQCKRAANCLTMGQKRKALKIIESSSKRGLELLGVEYGFHMAETYNFNHMPEKAIEVLNLVLSRTEANRKKKGRRHQEANIHVEAAGMLLARSYLRLNRPRKALPILEKLFPSYESRYGNSPNMSSYVVSLSFGRALQGVGRYRGSIKHLEKSVELTHAKSGSLDRQRIFAMYWLVEAYLKTGDLPKALVIANRIHDDRLEMYGKNHLESSVSAERLADVYLLVNEPEKAKEYLDSVSAKLELCDDRRLWRNRVRFKLAMVTANPDQLGAASKEFKATHKLFDNVDGCKSNAFPIFFDSLEPKIWLAESLALQDDKDALQLIEDFESEIKIRSTSLDDLTLSAQHLYRACVARYVVQPDQTLILRLRELIEILKLEHLDGAQAHLLEEARSLLGMVYLKLERIAKAKVKLESSFAALQSIDNPSRQTNQAIIDAGKRLRHFYLLTDASDDALRVFNTIKTIESSTDRVPVFTRTLIDKTLTTDSSHVKSAVDTVKEEE